MQNTIYNSGQDYDQEYADYVADLDFISGVARGTSGDYPILELACGTGRVTFHLARQGFNVHGVDLSETMLSEATRKSKLEPEHVSSKVTFKHGNMIDYKSPHLGADKDHKLVVIPFTSFLHLTSLDEQLATLKNCSRHLREQNGHLMVDIFNPDLARLAQGLTPHAPIKEKEVKIDGGASTLIRCVSTTYQPAKQMLRWQFFIEIYNNQTGDLTRKYTREATIRVIFPHEWISLLFRAGFTVTDRWGNYDMEEFHDRSRRMLFLARRTHNPIG